MMIILYFLNLQFIFYEELFEFYLLSLFLLHLLFQFNLRHNIIFFLDGLLSLILLC